MNVQKETETITERLHISPLNPELLRTIVAPSALSVASDISFHTLETFPERNYGFISLPKIEADKMKKKLNGSILKGQKVKIETARPSRKHKRDEDEELDGDVSKHSQMEPPSKKDKADRKKKSKDSLVELPGYELPEGRKVQRGWTDESQPKRRKDSKEKKGHKKKPASITGQAECLFRTKVPPNVATASDLKSKKKEKKTETVTLKGKEVLVHEFDKNIKYATFLRENKVLGNGNSAHYEEGKGWVTEDGTVVEEDPVAKTKNREHQALKRAKEERKKAKHAQRVPENEREDDTESSQDQDEKGEEGQISEDDSTSTSAASDVDNADKTLAEEEAQSVTEQERVPAIESSSSSETESESTLLEKDLNTKSTSIPEHEQEPTKPSTNPALEALFKPTGTETISIPSEAAPGGFSFFAHDNEDEDEPMEDANTTTATEPTAPQNIYQNNYEDDAYAPVNIDADAHEESSIEADGPTEVDTDPMTQFSTWFWQHRGETNRAWKRRRREAAKEKRQRENRKRSLRVA